MAHTFACAHKSGAKVNIFSQLTTFMQLFLLKINDFYPRLLVFLITLITFVRSTNTKVKL